MSEQETEESIFIEDEAWSNAEQQENEELAEIIQKEKENIKKTKEKEELTAEETVALLKIAVFGEEMEAHQKLGYKIPKSKENLSELSLEDEEKLWLIRHAMVKYAEVAAGEEKFSSNHWYLPHKDEIDLEDYTIGENQFRIKADSEEWKAKISEELGDVPHTVEIAEKIMRGEYDEPDSFKEELSKAKEEELLAEFEQYFGEIAPKSNDQKIAEAYQPPEESPKTLNEKLNDLISYDLGREIVRYNRCPVRSCEFRAPTKLSKLEKYKTLLNHFKTQHLSKVKGKSTLVGGPTSVVIGEDAHPEVGGAKETISGSANSEQLCKNIERLSDLETALPKEALPSVNDRRAMFDDLKSKTKRGDIALARSLSSIAPPPDELKNLEQTYSDYYYRHGDKVGCSLCNAKLNTIRDFFIHLRQAHPLQHKEPNKYRKCVRK